ncbi:hypothetical protein BE221DRAFT_144358 [Ostreococcus tauri]|uniref:Uncharacterized protein n=1 Tax=Ostreococcus tauri TaxID=70448 RepID=A0A1Y5IGH3_OSTTA|nr:hypothetical protein BE221DRAFT_144358 [Ostreococcus tauri]
MSNARAAVVVRAKGKRSRRAEFLDVNSEKSRAASGGKNVAGALGPISERDVDLKSDGRDEHFLFARRKSEAGDERWFPLGDVSFARANGTVDDVTRERYAILVDYAKKRHLKLCVGRAEIEIGARVQRGAKHPRAASETEVVVVADETSPKWDPADYFDESKRFGEFPAVLRLMNNAEPVTAAVKNQMLRASTQFAGATAATPNFRRLGSE